MNAVDTMALKFAQLDGLAERIYSAGLSTIFNYQILPGGPYRVVKRLKKPTTIEEVNKEIVPQ